MNLEDARSVIKSGKDRRRESEPNTPRRSRRDTQGRCNPRDPKNNHYTPLKTSPARMLLAIDRLPALQWPKGTEERPSLLKSKYFCRYHREYGHDTNRCRQLRQEIERLIQAGYLKDYVDKEKKRGQKEERSCPYSVRQEENSKRKEYKKKGSLEEDTSPINTPAKGIIHMIAGGPTDGDSGRARRAHARAARTIMEIDDKVSAGAPTIQFGPADTQGVHLPHNDALVISSTIANYIVRRIFVDSGSSVDILFIKVYQQIDLGNVPLEPVDTSLYGFAGEIVHPLGQISLPISLGIEPARKTIMVRFLVVDMPSAYNLILGRPTLNNLPGYHFHIPHEIEVPRGDMIGEVQGDQYTARRCYVEAIKSCTSKMKVDTPNQGGRRDLPLQEEQQHIIPARVQPAEELMSIQLVPGESSCWPVLH
ncbi:UNVERIFIED_CONTAM: hypothetical protein Slati_2645700 [Sesamum latifolium]|uniref:Uncharacterized protein n=1 Tax=Sesamum latifolium TaxID=2727402 RepID=A0AAW2VTW3_9LAMI